MVELSIRPYKFKNFKDIIELHESNGYRDMNSLIHELLPKVGYVVYYGKQPIACGFLRRLEPCYGQIDTLASNKFFGSEVRHVGIDMVVDALMGDAKRLKLKGIVCHTADIGILKRAESLGFKVVPQTIIAKPI